MAQITLKINGDISNAQNQINIVKQKLKELDGYQIKVSVDTSGIQALDKSMLKSVDTITKYTNAQAKLAKAEADRINAQTRAAAAEERKAKAAQQSAAAAKQASAAAQEQTRAEQAQLESHNRVAQAYKLVIKNMGRLNVEQRMLAQSLLNANSNTRNVAQSQALAAQRAGELATQVNRAAQAYQHLSAAQSSASGGRTANGAFQPTGLSTYVSYPRGIGQEIIYDVPNYANYGVVGIGAGSGTRASQESVTAGINQAGNAARNAAMAAEAMRSGFSSAWNTLKQGTPISDALGDSIGNIIVKIATWQVVNGIVASIKRAFTDALETMKAVDTELTNIQKVSNLSNAEIKRIGDTAYETASKYGVAADKYLEAVYTFQKAGLGENAEEMGELATKAMLVGDTTADVATTFLISANAAWKYNGNIAALSEVLDKADYLNNNFAVSLSDIAEAFPIVASTAAQAGLSVDQTMAAITTIVSQTAQSGNRAGTALRAIIMNLAGETGELENGVKVTEETIKSLNGILMQFEPEAVAAAEAAGTIVDPMKAIAALAKAVEAGVLNSGELFNIVSELGGKLRANQLNALVEGQETYNKALESTANAAGTADAEIEVMLSSWESKTQILQNTWTEFISHLVETNDIKAAMDVLTNVVEVLDSGFGQFAIHVAEAYAAAKLFAVFINSEMVLSLRGFIILLTRSTESAALLLETLSASPLFWAVAAVGIFTAITSAVDALNVSYEEQLEVVQKLNGEYEKQFGNGSEYEKLKAKVDDLTDSERARLLVLEGQREAAEAELKAQEKLASQKWLEENSRNVVQGAHWETTRGKGREGRTTREYVEDVTRADIELKNIQGVLDDANEAFDKGEISLDRYIQKLSNSVSTYQDYYNGLVKARDAGEPLTEQEQEFIRLYESAAGTVGRYTVLTNENSKAKHENAEATDELASAEETAQQKADQLEKQTKATSAALKDFESYGNLTTDSMNGLQEALGDSLDALFDETGALNNAGVAAFEAASKLDSAKAATEYLQIAAQKANYANLIAQIQAAGNAALMTTQQIALMLQSVGVSANVADAQARGMGMTARYKKIAGDTTATAQGELTAYLNAQIAALNRQMTEITTGNTKAPSGTTPSSTKDARLEALKEAVELEKQRLSYLEASGASEDERIAKMRDIQNALHEQAEYLRSIKASEKDVKALSTEWWEIQNDILKVYEEIDKAQRDAFSDTVDGLLDDLDALRDAEVETLQQQLDKLTAQHDAVKSQREEEEKLLAVEKARIALQNAQNERTVRQYNSATGQWEWVANAKTVADAEKELADAQKEVSDYRAEQLYQAQKEAIEKQIKATKEAFDAQKKAWQDAAKAVKNGSMSVDDGMSALKKVLDSGSTSINAAIQKLIASLNGKLQLPQVPEVDTSGYSADYNAARNAYLNGTMSAADAAAAMEAANRAANEARGLGDVVTANEDIAAVRNGTLGKGASGSGTSGGGSSGGGTSSTKSVSDYSADYNAARSAYLNGTMSAAAAAAAMEAANKGANALRGNGSVVTANEDIAKVRNGTLKYDGGGILHGLGGIKATQEDEMVVPSDLTKVIIKPALNNQTAEALDRMRVIYGLKPMTSLTNIGGTSSRIGTQNNGDTFNINGLSLPNVTRGTTLGELADAARGLPLHYNS